MKVNRLAVKLFAVVSLAALSVVTEARADEDPDPDDCTGSTISGGPQDCLMTECFGRGREEGHWVFYYTGEEPNLVYQCRKWVYDGCCVE
jgi:hypothetical protein